MSLVPGPIDPTANRGRSLVENLAQAARATSAASRFSSKHWSAIPNSPSTCRLAPKVSVSTASAPTARNDSWMSCTTSGRVRARMSTQFSHPQ
jgi:hypothetical protein